MLLSPLRYINPISGNRGSSVFSIAKSFYLDGVNESFNVVHSDLSTYFEGTNKKFTLSFLVNFNTITNSPEIIGNYNGSKTSAIVNVLATGAIVFYNSSTTLKSFRTNTGVITSGGWRVIDVVVDMETLSNCAIYVDGVSKTIASNTLTNICDVVVTDYKIGQSGNGLFFTDGYLSYISLIDRVLTSTEITNKYNNGKPKNPQSLFGANCKWFFNSDNSGDTAQFSVVDSVNSITATSVNMEDADKTPITPYSDPISTLVTKYSFINAWSFENQTINGTTSTLTDYKAIHDLSNPAIANQWTFIGGDANINNRASGYFVTDDYAYKSVANYNSGASTGSIHAVFTTNADVTTNNFIFGSSDESTSNYIFDFFIGNSKLKARIRNTTAVGQRYEFECSTTTILANTSYVVSVYQNGSTLQVLINGTAQSLNVTNGTAETYWFADIPNRDNITIGATIFVTAGYSDLDIAFMGVSDDFADATVLANHNELKTLYGI